jgi:hypothetical protein
MDASIAIQLGHRKLAWTAAGVAGAAGAVGFPMVGVPLALGVAAYAAIRLSKPHKIIRGRSLSPRQHRRAAVIAAGGMAGIAALSSGTIAAVDLANMLEHRLHDALAITHCRGALVPGQVLAECQSLVCAQATVVKLATPSTFGMAKLSGFALHEQTVYPWRTASGQSESSSAQK